MKSKFKLKKDFLYLALASFAVVFLLGVFSVFAETSPEKSCVYYSVPKIRSSTSVEVVNIEPWTTSDRVGYKVTVRNSDAITVASKVRVTAMISGWPYTWESEKTSLGGFETKEFTNELGGWKLGNEPVPTIVTLLYSDKISTVMRYCKSDPVYKEGWYRFSDIGWYPFVKKYNADLNRPKYELISLSSLYESKASSSFISEARNISSEKNFGAPTAALILIKPLQNRELMSRIFANALPIILAKA